MHARAALPLALSLLVSSVARPAFGPAAFGGAHLPWIWLAAGQRAAEWQSDAKLEQRQGRRVIEVEPREPAAALLVAISGTVEFERIDYSLDDGPPRSVDVFSVVRGSGLYEIASFDGERRVTLVRIIARALSPRSEIGARLGVR